MNKEQRKVLDDMELNIKDTENLMVETRAAIQDIELNRLMDELQKNFDAQKAILESLK